MNTALLIIDTQVGLFQGLYRAEHFLHNVRKLMAKASAPVIFVQDNDVGGVDTAEWQVHPDLLFIGG